MPVRASSVSVFYLVDLALYPSLLRRMFEADERPGYELLYLQTSYARHAQQGPVLINPSNANACATASTWVQQGAAIALHTHAPFSTVVEHYRGLLHVERYAAPPALFRYADPRLYAGLAGVLSEGEIHALLGPINTMKGNGYGEIWQLESPAPDAEPLERFRLTAVHEQALQSARDQAFCQQLASDHDVSYLQAKQWLQQMKQLPLATEYARWQGCQILAASAYHVPLSYQHMAQLASHNGSWQALLAELKALVGVQAPLNDGDYT
ncbi:DUF4123 domain-containing protein [Halomonas dongshanensis]|uniref:DUF4123 domain-containing protein n=1 Tax=Halomonas dongshanensis TaxID=2890835 RepID=A0ABT2ED95_9GAMM|nr:DUF4123 domain-containing protein [Halomonas dongshanensis]MCS2609459.1 DUF4123 domain-containing protein [Halomonas dongshanensis]